ncbi:hypothetical protein PNOK_0898500 [Pyrrhoderma noxium]|uniref:Uncharacterized protein n=1 Tax=Pyrrhoderma noxium TaxID=2282107 RepID=A0A286U6Q6_9AGAM|nr:hypothetical protein PNOK_0898500 [Pyrrhoderma noxium]
MSLRNYVIHMVALLRSQLRLITLLGKLSFWTTNISGLLSILAIDYILAIRVIALYNNSRLLSGFLKAMVVGEAIARLAIITKAEIIYDAFVLVKDTPVCGTDSNVAQINKLVVVEWSIQLAVACVLFLLVLYKSIKHWKLLGYNRNSLIYIIIRDQIVYYLIVMIFSAVAIIPSTFITDSLSISSYAIDILGNPGFLCLFGSRMFINLIEAGYSNTGSETITDDQSSGGGIISNVRFEDFSYPCFVGQVSTVSQATFGTASETGLTGCEIRENWPVDDAISNAFRSQVD